MTQTTSTSAFVHELYRDLLSHPEQAFTKALRCIQHEVGGDGGLAQLRDTRTGEMIPLADNNYPETAKQAYAEHFASVDPWQQRFINDQISIGVHRSDDIIQRHNLKRTEFYNDYWQQLGFGDAIGIFGKVGKHHAYTFGIPRLQLHGRYQQKHKQMLEPLRPHLHNAVALMLEMQLQKRRALIHNPLTEHLPLAVFLVDQHMYLLDHNQQADELLARAAIFKTQNSTLLTYHHKPVQSRILAMLKSCSRSQHDTAAVQPVMLSGECKCTGLPEHNIYVLPVFDSYLISFQIVVAVADQQLPDADMAQLLVTLFDLSHAEAQVANLLFNGHKPAAIAVARGVSVDTVRVQLKAIMAKAKCNSQLELVRRIGQLVIPFR